MGNRVVSGVQHIPENGTARLKNNKVKGESVY